MKKIFGIFFTAIFLYCGSADASGVVAVCEEVTLEVKSRGTYERQIDSCKGIKNCSQRADGSFFYKVPVTKLQVLDSRGGKQCPPKRSLVTVLENIPVDKVKGRFTAWNAMALEGVVFGHDLEQLHSVDGAPLPGSLGQEPVAVEQIVPCVRKGKSSGSGFGDICCEGLTYVGVVSNPQTCETLVGGGICIACGDGKCESPRENHCNCPKDCARR